MSEAIDCRGLACPEPVLRTKGALEGLGEGVLTVRVDNPASRENVKRFAESQGCAVQVKPEGEGAWALEVVKGYACEAAPGERPAASPATPLATALMILSDRLGPEPELGGILMRAFLGTLTKATEPPAKVLFLNRGVYLTTEGSEVLDVLREVEDSGVEVLSCGTCLEFFGKREHLRVGKVSNMYDTVETLTGGFKVVTVS